MFAKFTECGTILFRQFVGHRRQNLQDCVQIPLVPLGILDSLALETETRATPDPGRDLESRCPLQKRYLDLRSQRGFDDGDRYVDLEVETIAMKPPVPADADL